jgi:hypothetical protein
LTILKVPAAGLSSLAKQNRNDPVGLVVRQTSSPGRELRFKEWNIMNGTSLE